MSQKRPNIVYIMTDDHGTGALIKNLLKSGI